MRYGNGENNVGVFRVCGDDIYFNGERVGLLRSPQDIGSSVHALIISTLESIDHAEEIAELNNRIDDLEKEIAKLNNRIDDLENDIEKDTFLREQIEELQIKIKALGGALRSFTNAAYRS